MSGDHNMYCSGNQPDIVMKLRTGDFTATEILEAANTIETLRTTLKQSATMGMNLMNENASLAHYCQPENEK
jgi:hypothetical protein